MIVCYIIKFRVSSLTRNERFYHVYFTICPLEQNRSETWQITLAGALQHFRVACTVISSAGIFLNSSSF